MMRARRAALPRGSIDPLVRRARAAGIPLGTAALCVLLGLFVARPGRLPELAVAAVASFALGILGAQLKFSAVVAWLAFSGLAYDFVRYPTQHAFVTFDRVWVLAMLGWLMTERKESATSRESRLILVSGACLVVAFGYRALLTSGHVQGALETWLDAGILPAILFVAARRGATTAAKLDMVGGAFAVSGAILGTLGIGQRILGLNISARLGASATIDQAVGLRVSGPYQTDDILAVALLMCFAGTLYWMQLRRAPRLSVGLVIVALELGGIYLTFFRGAYVGVLVIAIVALGFRPKRFARLLGAAGCVLALALVAYLQVSDTSGVSQRITNGQNINGRFATYQEGLKIFESRPLTGAGVGQFGAAEANVATVAVNGVQGVNSAHSSYVDALAETGLAGFIPLVAFTIASGVMMISLIRSSTEPHDTLLAAAFVGALLAFFLMSTEETTILISTDNLFLALVLGIASARVDILKGKRKATGRGEPGLGSAPTTPRPRTWPPARHQNRPATFGNTG